MRRVRKLKSLEIVRRFEDTYAKLGEKCGVMCEMLRMDVSS